MIVMEFDTVDIVILLTWTIGVLTIMLVAIWRSRRSDAKFNARRRINYRSADTTRNEIYKYPSEFELAQARQEGVNSVLECQTHTHDTPAD